MAKWASGEALRQETATVLVAATVEPTPQALPPALELCLKRSLRDKRQKPAKDMAADALLLAELKTKRQRELCAYELLKWHEAQRVKTAKK